MAKIKHIALTTGDPDKAAAFYKEAFDMQEIRRSDNGAVFLTDGYINLAILNYKTAATDADVGPNGDNYDGIHHFGFQVESVKTIEEAADTTANSNTYGAVAESWIRDEEGYRVDISEGGWPI